MRVFGLLIMCGVLLLPQLAVAGDCRQLEYAEIKDMSSGDLIKIYCRYGVLADINHKGFFGTVKFSIKKADEYKTNANECREMQAKIRTAMKKQSLPEEPDCDAIKGKP